MGSKRYQVKELAQLASVTVRTLHHYDQIGLLPPSHRSGAGYRLYDADDLLRLQQIMLGRAMGLSLEEIRGLLDDPNFDHKGALLRQRDQLTERIHETATMLRSVNAALARFERTNTMNENTMDDKALFGGFEHERYAEEVQELWGNTDAYEQSVKRTSRYSKDAWAGIKAESEALMTEMAAICKDGSPPVAEDAVHVAEKHRLHIDRWFYACGHAMHVSLAQMYVADERFAKSFNKHHDGLAAFFAAAIQANARKER